MKSQIEKISEDNKEYNVTPWHEFLIRQFGTQLRDFMMKLPGVDTPTKVSRLLTGTDDWSAEQIKALADTLDIDWYWDFTHKYEVPNSIRIDVANKMRDDGTVFQPVFTAA